MKQIKGYQNYYVTTDGRIFNLKRMVFLKKMLNNCGYPYTCLYNDNGGKFFLVHRLMAEAFLSKIDGKNYVNHIDGDKSNNLLSNLKWCTQQENSKHAWELGLNKTSQKQRDNAKRTIKIAAEISSKMRRKSIIDTSNGRTFNYAKEAAEYLGVRKQTLTNWLNGHRPNKTTLKYI